MDVGVVDEKILLVEPEIDDRPATRTIDATDKIVFPGFIDAHTHMGIPIMGTRSIDDFESGSIAAACGGVTTIIDFTVQEPGQTLQESIDVRLAKADGKSHIDYALHVNVTDQPQARVAEIPAIVEQGFSAFKVFSTYKQAGMMIAWPEFRNVLEAVQRQGALLCLHAEDDATVEKDTAANIVAKRRAAICHPRSRTPAAEAMAITQAADIARELGAQLYIVHLSSKAGLDAALAAREQGAKLILETCPQYLVLSEACYLKENGHHWITTPPLRTEEDCEALWDALSQGQIDVVATDHCPFTRSQKDDNSGRFHLTPNGIPGVETLFPLLYTYGVAEGRLSLERLVQVLATNPARIFGFCGQKGVIEIGADADFTIWDPEKEWRIKPELLHGNADWSPYVGMTILGAVAQTILRGFVLAEYGDFVGTAVRGNLVLKNESNQTLRN